jgi:hypothetical protein
VRVSKQPPDDHAEKIMSPVIASGFTEDALVKDVNNDESERPLELEQDAFPITEISRSKILDFPENNIGVDFVRGIECTFRGVGPETAVELYIFKVQAVLCQTAPESEPFK